MTTPRRNSYDLHPHADAGSPPVAEHPDRACNNADPEIFFPHTAAGIPADYSLARKICGRCRYQQPCAEWAVRTRQAWGVWGGTTPAERRQLTKGEIA